MNMENNLSKLRNDLQEKAVQEYETNVDNYIEGEFTDKDRETIEQMKGEIPNQVVVTDEDPHGTKVNQPISEYAKSLDDRVAEIKDDVNGNKVIKLINSGDIKANGDELKEKARQEALKACRNLATKKGEDLTDEDYIRINDSAIEALTKYFKLDRLTSDAIMPKLRKTSLAQIHKILPEEFANIYIDNKDLIANGYRGKEQILSVIEYLCVTGPELDYLNQYIDDENKLAMVSQRILRCQVDFMDMLKDEKTMSELVARTVEIAPNDESFWSKYIKIPNRISNEFAQRYVLQEKYKEAYTKLLDEYPITDDMSEHEVEINMKARDLILDEIAEATNKMEVYKSITNLDLFKELYVILEDRYMHGVKMSQKFLIKECMDAIERAKKCKLNVPYPGYKGTTNKVDQIFKSYMIAYPQMIGNYNKAILDVCQKVTADGAPLPETNIEAIALEDYSGKQVAKVFSLLLSVMMGRIMKKCTGNNQTKYDAIILDSYFQMFCRLGMDIYVMNDIWVMMKPLVKYILDNVTFNKEWDKL